MTDKERPVTETKTSKRRKPAKDAPKPRPVIVLREASTLKDLAEKMKLRPKDLLEKLAAKGYVLDANDIIDESLAARIAKDLDSSSRDHPRRERRCDAGPKAESRPRDAAAGRDDHGPRRPRQDDAPRRHPLLAPRRQGIGRDHPAHRRLPGRPSTNGRSRSSTRPATKPSPSSGPAGPRSRTSSSWSSPPTKASCPRPRKPSTTPKPPAFRSSSPSTRSTSPKPTRTRSSANSKKKDILVEEWGGDVISVAVSAKEKKNIDELLEMILLLADVIEIKANPKVPAQGVVLEARLDAKKGPLATVIIQNGTLTVGEAFLAGTTFGKVRALIDENGQILKAAGPVDARRSPRLRGCPPGRRSLSGRCRASKRPRRSPPIRLSRAPQEDEQKARTRHSGRPLQEDRRAARSRSSRSSSRPTSRDRSRSSSGLLPSLEHGQSQGQDRPRRDGHDHRIRHPPGLDLERDHHRL